MTDRQTGVFSFADNFECSLSAPLDARMTTPLKSQLTGFTGMYLGMLVVVTEDTDNNGLYRLKQNTGTSLTDWEQIGTGGSITVATSNALGGVKIGYTKSGTNYPVELDAEKAYVNVSEISDITDLSTNFYSYKSTNDTAVNYNTTTLTALLFNYNVYKTNNNSAVSTNSTNISTNTSTISDLSTNFYSYKSTNDTAVGNNAGAISTNTSTISDLSTNFYSYKSTNDTAVGNNATAISSNTSSISTNATNIASNTSSISTNATNIASNTSSISTNATNIASNTSSISTNATNIATNTSSISTNATNIASNTTDIATNATNIASNTTDIATNATNIASNTTDIATNATNIASNTTDIASNTTDIASNTTDIATNATNISTNTSNISNLQNAGYITKDITNQVTITNDTQPQLTIKPSSSSGESSVLRIEGRRDTSTSASSGAIEFYNYDDALQTTSLFGRIVTRKETSSSNVGKMRFQVSATGSTVTAAVLDLTSDRVAKFLGDANFVNIPTHGDYALLSTNSTLNYNNITQNLPSEFNPPEAESDVRGGIKIGYTQSGTTYPVQLSSEQAYVDINGFNSDLSDYSQSANIDIESTAGSVTLKANVNAQLRSVNSDSTLTKLYTEGTTGHIYGFTKDTQRLLVSSNGRINLTAENGIWLKCMATTGSIGKVNFGQKDSDNRYNTIETYTTNVTGEPYMAFNIHDGVDDGDDNTQVTPLKLYGDKLIQGTHMELLSDIHTDGGANNEPNLLVTTSSVSGFDSAISIRGSRNGSTTSNEANLLFENFDSNRNGGTVGLLGKISGRVTNAGTNVGDMVFYSSTDGSATAETMRVTRTNTLKLTGELERPTNAYMTEVGTYQANTTNIGGTNGPRYIAWNNSTTNEGLTHTGSSAIPNGSLWTKTSAGQGHYRINVVLGCDSMTGTTRSVFCLYVYTYSGATSTLLPGTDKQQYFVGNGYGRAFSNTNKVRFGGTIDLYLNQADQFEIVVDKIYGGSQSANLTANVTQLIVERIH